MRFVLVGVLLLAVVLCGCQPKQAAAPTTPPPAPVKATPPGGVPETLDEPVIPNYVCMRAPEPPVIDGVMNDPGWGKAPVLGAFAQWDGEPAAQGTRAKVMWDDENLYVAFSCQDSDIQGTMSDRDMNLWEENEVVEVFVDPEADGLDYRELEFSPLNTQIDLLIPSVDSEMPLDERKAWDAEGMESAVLVEGTIGDSTDTDNAWNVEVAIPMAALDGPPKAGDEWRVGLYRIDAVGDAVEFQAWSPTYTDEPSFHVPERFGVVTFTEDVAAGEPTE